MKNYKLIYTEAAENSHQGWERQSLPIGNSFLGTCIFGRTDIERLQINEKSLWTGGPSEVRHDYIGGNIEGSGKYTEQIQQALAAGDYKKVLKLKNKLIGLKDGYGAYQNFGDIFLNFGHTEIENYKRWLDLNEAVAYVGYKHKGATFSREHFASYPNRVVATKIASNRPKTLNFKLSVVCAQDGAEIVAENMSITVFGNLADNGMEYFARISVVTDGSVAALNQRLEISDASFAEIYYSAATDYKNTYPTYRGESQIEAVNKRVEDAVKLGYSALKKEHIDDYGKIFNRMSLSFCEDEPNLATDKLLSDYGDGGNSRYLEELLFQYGRYLLISSSREGDLPANLQGVWNDSNNPPWGSDYHLNVNLQMCYWHAYTANLTECAPPMLEYIKSLRQPGRVTANAYHDIESTVDNPENGWVCHTQNTPFGWTCPGWDFYWGWSPAASSWMMQNLFDYYAFTLDKELLKTAIYPTMKENAKFWLQNLTYNDKQDRYVSSPSFSPEQGPISIGNTYEQTLIYQLFEDTLSAAKALGDFDDVVKKIAEVKHKLKPLSIGRWGQIKEWYEEDDWCKFMPLRKLVYTKHRVQPRHRHCSHLLGAYPCSLINRHTPELSDAVKVSLHDRGFGTKGFNDSGWGKVNKVCLWARVKEGENSYSIIRDFIKKNIATNLWDLHPPFQMDGNCGYTAGVTEMLLYSAFEDVELLPALPDAWSEGKVYGICARGGYQLDFRWKDKKITSFKAYHKDKKDIRVLATDKTTFLAKEAKRDGDYYLVKTELL